MSKDHPDGTLTSHFKVQPKAKPVEHEDATPGVPTEPETFRPEGAEWEPAGGVIQQAPVPEEPSNPPTEGDKR